MKKAFYLFFISFFLLTACSKNEKREDHRSYHYFAAQLKAGMDYTAIVNTFGPPDSDKGSGIHIYVYRLTDGTELWIGYTDKILYARQVDSNGGLLHTLV